MAGHLHSSEAMELKGGRPLLQAHSSPVTFVEWPLDQNFRGMAVIATPLEEVEM